MSRFAQRYAYLRRLVDRRLSSVVKHSEPRDLADASRYILRGGGKRVRSTLVLLSCEAVGGRVQDAIDAAVAVEMLHNFTLVHDDVMDNAPTRRGRATVHTRWNLNTAILVGDTVLGLAYRSLLRSTTPNIRRAAQLFTEGFIDVCEGQAFDLEYERRRIITLQDYYRMIGKKTGKLIATATELGGLLGNGSLQEVDALRTFGTKIGRAFQIQDDLLDVVADAKAFGKTIGGDIVEGKKTFLLVQAFQYARGTDRKVLRPLMAGQTPPATHAARKRLIATITDIYQRCGAIEAARNQIRRETAAGIRALHALRPTIARDMLQWFSEMLVQRNF